MTDAAPRKKEGALRWHLLGGNNKNRIGANCGLCVYEDASGNRRHLLFDAGLMSGDPRRPEDPALADSDTVIPDITRFLEKPGDPAHRPVARLDAIFLTHNHPDHLGALPFLALLGYRLPRIYATPYTVKRLEQEFSNMGVPPEEWPEVYAIAPGNPVKEGPVSVTAFWVSHSTPQSVGFFIESPAGNALNPGDFKLDQTVVWGPAFSAAQFRRIAGKGVDMLLLDSTGADRDIPPVTEEDMRQTLRGLMKQYPNKRFVVAVMSGFEENLASVASVAAENGRRLWVAGWSHEQALSALRETGLTLSESIGAEVDLRVLSGARATRELAEARPRDSVVVVTGAQGKPGAALTRAAEGRHGALKLDPKTDVILFCAPSIPGQEAGRARLLFNLKAAGHTVLTRAEADLYPHAHARLPEILALVQMAGAATVVPIHGDAHLRASCLAAMEKIGQHAAGADNGDVLHVDGNGGVLVEKGQPRLTGFKTLQGGHWTDRHYLMVNTRDVKGDAPPVNDNGARKKPKIFDIGPK